MRPRNKNIRRYGENEKGTRTFNIEDIEAEIPYVVTYAGNVYVGQEFSGMKVQVLVFREKKHETSNI